MHSLIRYILIVCVFSFSCLVSAQNQIKADSIKRVIESEELKGEQLLEAYYFLSTFSTSPDLELGYAEQLLQFAEEQNNQPYIVRANLRIGVANRLLGNLKAAQEYLFQSAEAALAISESEPILVDIYAEISTCYTQNGDSANALRYGRKSIDILRQTDRKQELALNLINLGYDYYLISKYDSAMTCYNESELLLLEINMKVGLAYIVGNKALVYWKLGDRERAIEDLYQAISMLEPFEDNYGMADYHNQLGKIYMEVADVDKSIENASKGLQMATSEGLKEQIRDANYLLYQLNKLKGNYKKAVEYQTLYYQYKDSIQNLDVIQELADLRTKFEVGKKQSEVDLLKEQKRSNQLIMVVGALALIICIILLVIIYFYARAKTKLNEQLEEQKDSLMSVNKTKDKFFSIVSHDLRGPVNVLSGLVGVTKYFVDNKNEQLKEMLDKMGHSVDRLVTLLDSLLHWSMQQQGNFPYVPERLNLSESLTDVKETFEDMAVAKDIELALNVNNETELYVDINTASTIFRNLLNNAIKFTPNGGKVSINTKENKAANRVVIEFSDTGVGIPDEKIKSLFELSGKFTTKGTSGEAGLGLGLQLVHEFVQLNKGEIEVESQVEKGTTFRVSLPMEP